MLYGREESYVPVRIDYSLWVYNFQRSGVTESCESAVVYSVRRSTLDYDSLPSKLQIDQALKDIGLPKAQRDELLAQVELHKDSMVRARALRAYAARFPRSDISKNLTTLR